MNSLIAYVYGSTDKEGKFHLGGSEFRQIAGPAETLKLLQEQLDEVAWIIPISIGYMPADGNTEKVRALTQSELRSLT